MINFLPAIILGVLILIATWDYCMYRIPNVLAWGLTIFLCLMNYNMIIWAFFGFIVGVMVYKNGFLNQRLAVGDIKLAMLLGAAFGPIGIPLFLGAIWVVRQYRRLSKDNSPLAFAPFVLTATIVFLACDYLLKAIVL